MRVHCVRLVDTDASGSHEARFGRDVLWCWNICRQELCTTYCGSWDSAKNSLPAESLRYVICATNRIWCCTLLRHALRLHTFSGALDIIRRRLLSSASQRSPFLNGAGGNLHTMCCRCTTRWICCMRHLLGTTKLMHLQQTVRPATAVGLIAASAVSSRLAHQAAAAVISNPAQTAAPAGGQCSPAWRCQSWRGPACSSCCPRSTARCAASCC